MVTLSDIRGQDRAIDQLRRAIALDRVAHAYLFTGPGGCGKYTAGLAFAAALNCTEKPGDGCGECAQCIKIADHNHPDVTTLAREGAAQIIPIQTIRAQVLATIGSLPHEGRARVFLIEEATSMQGPAANALLKTLEEPPTRTHFVLATTAPHKLLPTIRSRCQRVSFGAVPADLRAHLDGDDERQERISAVVDSMLAASSSGKRSSAFDATTGVDKADVAPVLALLASRLHRDAVEFAAHAEDSRARQASKRATAVLETAFAVSTHNAHGQLALEDLLFRLQEMQ